MCVVWLPLLTYFRAGFRQNQSIRYYSLSFGEALIGFVYFSPVLRVVVFSLSLSKMKTKKRENGKRGRDRNSELDLCNKRPMSHVCQRASKRSHGGENEKIPKLSLNSRGNFSNCVRVLLLLFCTESNCDCARTRLSNSWKRFISSSPSTYFYISKSPLPNRETEHPEHLGRL